MYYQDTKIFGPGSLYDRLEQRRRQIKDLIDGMELEQLTANSDAEIVQHCLEKFSIEPLVLCIERKELKHTETRLDVSHNQYRNPCGENQCYTKGLLLTLTVPYVGDEHLWSLQPGTFQFPPFREKPKNIIKPRNDEAGNLSIRFEYAQDSASDEQINRDIKNEISTIQINIEAQKKQLAKDGKGLQAFIIQSLEQRRKALGKLNDVLSKLNIPIKPRSGMPDIQPIKIKKRLISIGLKTNQDGSSDEPGISSEIFTDIIAILRFMGRTFEETAQTFSKLKEDDLRNVFLASLNGYFEGELSGEMFRKGGKADICIKEKNKSAFVAECKIWHGQKSVSEALNQLLGYLTWRDCKASLIIFNKENANFSKLLTETPDAIRKHSLFIREPQKISKFEGEWDFVIKNGDNTNREIMLHVFVFNLYCKEK
jgi:hypothetical protein